MAFHLVTPTHLKINGRRFKVVSIPSMAFHLVTALQGVTRALVGSIPVKSLDGLSSRDRGHGPSILPAANHSKSLNSLDGLSSRGRLVASGRMGQANRFCLNSLDGLSSRDQLSLASFGKDLASLNSLDGFSSRDIDRFLETFTLRKSQFPRWPFIS